MLEVGLTSRCEKEIWNNVETSQRGPQPNDEREAVIGFTPVEKGGRRRLLSVR